MRDLDCDRRTRRADRAAASGGGHFSRAPRAFRQLLAHPGRVLRAGERVLRRRRDLGRDLFPIDGLKTELLAEVTLSAVGHEIEVLHALGPRARSVAVSTST